ncbi:hypothetical protein EIP86_002483 [Pleurotus ostreatoroseus]|nr:hypothetical protein EIP86_002483 [Pleurotus ostreatoroseus]
MASQRPLRTSQTNTFNAYFRSPIDVLLDSVEDDLMEKVSMHDLTQAYGLFSSRVKAFSEAVCDDVQRSDTITYLQVNSSVVSRCLIRDIRRVITPLRSIDDDTALFDKPSKDLLHEARDVSVLAQNNDITHLLECILDVLDEPLIPAPGERKIRSLAAWALSAIRASSMVLEDLAMDILHFLVNLMRKKQETEVVLCDAWKRYLPSSLGLLEHVLRHLVGPSIQLRKYAALALVGYTQALLAYPVPASSNDPSCRNNLSTRICEFVEEQVAAHKDSCQSREELSGETPGNLVDIIRAEIPQDGMSPPGLHVGWAFNVLHALVILSDGQIYTRPVFLKFVMKTIHPCLVHTWEPLLVLHSGVWRALVWAFTRVPRIDEIEDSQGMPSSQLNGANRREAVLKTIRQLPGYNVGSTVVYALMGPGMSRLHASTDTEATKEPDNDDIIQAISVIKQLVEDPVKEKRIEGIGLLAACTNNEVDTKICGPFDTRRVLLDVMSDFDLIDAEHGHVEALTKETKLFVPNAIRIFTDEELVTHWHLLVDIWDEAVREAVQLGGRRALDIGVRD